LFKTTTCNGPYNPTEGVVTSLDGSGSTDPNGSIVSWEWDLDGDGMFDDASGPLPNPTFPQNFVGVIGLKVTDNDGRTDVDYAWIDVANANSPPTIDSFSPPFVDPINLGVTVPFQLTSSDPDNDSPLTTDWFVNGSPVFTGPNFNYNPILPSEVGMNIVQAVVSDNNPQGGSLSQFWGVPVLADNNPPLADAGPNQVVTTGDTVNLDGSGSSDPDMNPLTFSWSMTVPPGSTAVLSDPTIVNPTFDADLPGDYVAELIVNDGIDDSAPDSVTITANFPSADLELTKTVNNPTPNVGDPITFLVTVTNNGPNTATGVLVEDLNLPPVGMSGVSVSFFGNGFNPVTGIWDVGTILSGQSLTFEITGTVTTTNPITNTAEINASDQNDPDSTPDNQNAQEDDQATAIANPPVVQVQADLSISKSDSSDPIVAGNTLTYTVRVDNAGPDAAQDVVVTDTLPAGVTLVSTSGCAEDPNGVPACSLGTIASGGFKQYTISVFVDSNTIGTIQNSASVASSTALINIGDDSATENTTVNPPAPLDAIPPTAICQDVTVALAANGQTSITALDVDGGSSDDVGIQSLSVSPNIFSCSSLGANTVTLTVTDTSGNTSTCQAVVTVEDPQNACLVDNQVIGGEIIPIEATSLILAGAQSFSWMIPVVLSILGIGLFVVSRKSE